MAQHHFFNLAASGSNKPFVMTVVRDSWNVDFRNCWLFLPELLFLTEIEWEKCSDA